MQLERVLLESGPVLLCGHAISGGRASLLQPRQLLAPVLRKGISVHARSVLSHARAKEFRALPFEGSCASVVIPDLGVSAVFRCHIRVAVPNLLMAGRRWPFFVDFPQFLSFLSSFHDHVHRGIHLVRHVHITPASSMIIHASGRR